MTEKQAVVLIHGIGEQKPMSTLRGFVDAVWTKHDAIHHPNAGGGMWSKPDNISGSFELRRLTTPQNIAGIQTDFFEFYWAHLMEGTSYGHVLAWARSLILRSPSTVPPQLKGVYWVLLALLTLALVITVYAVYSQAAGDSILPSWLSGLGSLSLLPLAGFIVVRVVGDAARYLHVAPTNIQRRHEIRRAGVDLLKQLHNPARGYSRIIIVGHSLGSVIGYDILTHAWIDYHAQFSGSKDKMLALDELEHLANSDDPPPELVQSAQRRYFNELKANGNAWRVTDFVTLGSPLAHASILLAEDALDLRQKQEDREFPRCLPTLETVQPDRQPDRIKVKRFSYEYDRRKVNSYRLPHHAAVFGPTRWTNLFFPCRAMIWGDIVGGPLKGVMGEHIRDVPVRTRGRFGFLAHTLYWSYSPGSATLPHIEALREVLDLTDRRGGPTGSIPTVCA